MNEEQIKGKWNEVKGSIKEQWGKLTDDDIEVIDGKLEQLSGAIQRRYGKTKEEAEREIESWQ
jgi:uncharacterized protein YjbJ (UPF0337 family)